MTARRFIVLVVALLLSAQVIRNAAVGAFAASRPVAAAELWGGHPAVEISLGLAAIGQASRARSPIDRHIFALVDDAAAKSPLSPEPFLVRGVEMQKAGNRIAAVRAFGAAQWRDPRSLSAAYFLADHYFRTGDSVRALQETALLARLAPGGTSAVAPFLAAAGRNPSNWPQLRALFRSEQGVEDAVLMALAQDPANLDALLALADKSHRSPDSPWLGALLAKLVDARDYVRARALWSSIGGGRPQELVFDTGFSRPGPPPPFNWWLSSSSIGLAERQPGGRLHAIFYGNVDGVLASQLVMLTPGAYRMELQMAGTPVHPEVFHWSVRCAGSGEPLSSVGVDDAASRGWTFAVPASCPAQWLELSGTSSDISQQAEVTISALRVTRARPNA
jgi:hypothetical protein